MPNLECKDNIFVVSLQTKIISSMEIKKSAFVVSAPTVSKCPNDDKIEYAFIGRSNVGKSSLINMLCNHKGLAKTSATPGKTLLINHFIINDEWYLVDLPGYGYAKRSKTVQQKLEQMIAGYILQRKQLVNVFVLIDVRHDPQKIDREFIDWLGESGVPFAIIFTKADKLGPGKAKMNAQQWMNTLKDRWETLPPYFITSSEKKLGRDAVLDYIDTINHTL
jgi:ribosome biogenesis GTP-binding protein ysxC